MDSRIICRKAIETIKPMECFPHIIYYIHAVADSPVYRSEGRLRSAESHCIFHYTLKGTGECWIGNEKRLTKPGQGFLHIINDPSAGYGYPVKYTGEWEFVCLCFEGGNTQKFVYDMLESYGPIYSISNDNIIMQQFLDEKRWEKGKALSNSEGIRLVNNLFLELIQSVEKEDDFQLPKLIQSAKEVIRQRVAQNISIDELAQVLYVSREHLSRLFHLCTGEVLSEYIKEQRILYACQMLKQTDITIGDLANILCCSSTANFIRSFRNVMNMTPGEFRKNGTVPIF